MKIFRSALVGAFALALLAATQAGARDLYKPFLDPAIPHHRAILDTVEKLKSEPQNASLHNDLGCLVAWDGFWRDALREFSEAEDLDEHDSRPSFNSGLVRAWKSEWGGAARSFRRAVKRDPGNWAAWWMLGFAEEQQGNVESAVDAYKTSLRVDTSLFDVRVNPFAAQSKLKARALLETYEKRMVRANLPGTEQLADADRVTMSMQRSKDAPPAPVVVEKEKTAEEEEPARTGPVVSTVAPSTGGGTSSPPASVSRPGTRYVPPRGESRPAPAPLTGAPAGGGKSEADADAKRRLWQASVDGVDPDRVSPGAAPIASPTPTPSPNDN